ncbi:hypothetical protein DSECCO2_478300 [anaerobic digester metagenome]
MSDDRGRSESLNIINALRRGTVPASGLARLAVGIEVEEGVIARQLAYVADGGGDLKFIKGDYGAGKTFLLARALELAQDAGFATTHVVVSSETPLARLRSVYQRVAANLRTRDDESAFKAVLDSFLYAIEERVLEIRGDDLSDEDLREETVRSIERSLAELAEGSTAFAAAVRAYYEANADEDYGLAQGALGWLAGEPNVGRPFRAKAGVRGTIDETVALAFLVDLIAVVRGAGYSGLVIALDEAETTQALPRAQREKAYNNLRQLIDLLDRSELSHCYLLVTGTPSLFEGAKGVRSVPPLADRIGTVGDDGYRNPLQPQLTLSRFDAQKLEQVALRVMDIYAEAHGEVDRERVSHRFIRAQIRQLTGRFGGRVDVIPRLFLREFVDVLDKAALYPEYDPWDAYRFDPAATELPLNEEEEAVMVVEW